MNKSAWQVSTAHPSTAHPSTAHPSTAHPSRFRAGAFLDLNQLVLDGIYGTKKIFRRIQKRNSGKYLVNKLHEIENGLLGAQKEFKELASSQRGDVPGWVLVVLMTTGLVTGIWTVAQPRLSSILKNSLDNMNSIR